MQTNRLPQGSGGVARPALVRERRGELGAGLQTRGTYRQRAPRRRGGVVEVSLLEQRLAQIDVRVDEVGFDRDRPAIATDRLLALALVLERIAEVAVGVGEIGPQSQGAPLRGDRGVQFAAVPEGVAEIAVVGGLPGIQRDRLGDQPLGGFVSAGLAGEHAEQMPTISHGWGRGPAFRDRALRLPEIGRRRGSRAPLRTGSKRRGSWAEAGEDLVLRPRVVAFDSLGSLALAAPLGKLVNLP